MHYIEGKFKGIRNTEIYYQTWIPEEKVKGTILLVHGIGEHSGRYLNVVNHFVPLGYAIYGFDNMGHGKSGGKREVVKRFDDLTETLGIYYEMVAHWQPDAPLYILGHSLGGLITSYYLIDNQSKFKGAILSGPSVKLGDDITGATIFFGKIIAAIAPGLGLISIDTKGVSRDESVVRAYDEDPLVFHKKTPARLASEILKAMLRVQAEAQAITLPILLLQGSRDRIVNSAGAKMLFDAVTSTDKTLLVYDGLYHEVFNEPERDRVLKDVEEWLAKRM